jgi:hypothetical protein
MCCGLFFAHVSDAFDEMVFGPLLDTNQVSLAEVGSCLRPSTETANLDLEPELYQAFAFPNPLSIDALEHDISVSTSSSSGRAIAHHLPADGKIPALSHESWNFSGTFDVTAEEDELVELVAEPTRPHVESIAAKKPR